MKSIYLSGYGMIVRNFLGQGQQWIQSDDRLIIWIHLLDPTRRGGGNGGIRGTILKRLKRLSMQLHVTND